MSVEDCEVVVTRGGARAMLDRRVGEVMHPVVGPAIEATTVATRARSSATAAAPMPLAPPVTANTLRGLSEAGKGLSPVAYIVTFVTI